MTGMPIFHAHDGTELAYRLLGKGAPLICLPGGPMRAGAYLGDLGGLSAHRQLVVLDLRGSGDSAAPEDPTSYRCDRLTDDIEALREHLGEERIDLLAHSASGNLASLYAARHPQRLRTLSAHADQADVAEVLARVADGSVRPVIGTVVPFDRAIDAFALLDEGAVHGKAVVTF